MGMLFTEFSVLETAVPDGPREVVDLTMEGGIQGMFKDLEAAS
jgi:hypothetical protein